MNTAANPEVSSPHPGLGFGAFVVLMACFMALNALAIDSMLPALPHIGAEFNIADPNSRQWVITAYLLGFGGAQIFYGPMADRFGRRKPLLFGVALYTVASLITALATSFEFMLLMRVFQGIGAAATRVLVVAIVRDCYSGRQMASVMSLTMIVFLAVPILAPMLGQIIMLFVSWHWIFGSLAILGCSLFIVGYSRLPETLKEEDRIPLSFSTVAESFKVILTTRHSIGYTVAMTFMLGALLSYINSAQQVFTDIFNVPTLFTLIFAVSAASMALASFLNSRIVEKLGTRVVSHGAMISFAVVSALSLITAWTGHETLLSFSVFQCLLLFCFGLTAPNFGSMAMEPVGRIAGAAAAVQGCITTLGAAVLGFVVGQSYQGTTVPLLLGYLILSLCAIVVVWMTEGKLFQPIHENE